MSKVLARLATGGSIDGFSASLSEFPDDHITVAVIANTIGKDVGDGATAKRIERLALEVSPTAE